MPEVFWQFIWHTIAGSYLFAGAGFVWTFAVYRILAKKLDDVWIRVTNHQEHDLEDIKRRLDDLEAR
jgi:hypothetical protein